MATKGGGSLLGRADSTLASMSYREAMADVGPDLKSVYQDEVLNQAMFDKGVQDHFDTLYADNNALADELKDATTKAMEGLGTDYEGMELFNNELTSMKQRMKALPKGKKGDFERSKIRAEMNMLLNSSKGLDEDVTKVGTMIKAGEFNKHTTDYPVLLSIANGTAKKIIDNGKLMYSIPNPDGGEDLKIDRQGVKDALGQSDLEFEKDFVKLSSGQNAKGKQKGTTFDRQGSINAYEDLFPSEAALAANMNRKQGSLPYTFVQALTGKDGSDSIYKALMDMGPTTIEQYDKTGGPDGKPDGKITAADFANKENGIELIKSLTEPRSKNYNYQAAKRAAAEFYTDNIDQKDFDDGVALRTKTGGSGSGGGGEENNYLPNIKDGGSIQLGFYGSGARASVRKNEAISIMKRIEQGLPFAIGEGDGRHSYSYKNGAWYEDFKKGDNEDSESYMGSVQSLVGDGLGTNDDAFMNLVTTVQKESIVDTNIEVDDDGVPIVKTSEQLTSEKLHTKIFDQIAKKGINDDTAAEKLNSLFNLNNGAQSIEFMPFNNRSEKALQRDAGGTGVLKADAPGTDDIMLYNPRTGEVVKDEQGNRIRFKTGQEISILNEKGLSTEISEIIKILKEQNIKIPGPKTNSTASIDTSVYPKE